MEKAPKTNAIYIRLTAPDYKLLKTEFDKVGLTMADAGRYGLYEVLKQIKSGKKNVMLGLLVDPAKKETK
jgi:hypothetical protein